MKRLTAVLCLIAVLAGILSLSSCGKQKQETSSTAERSRGTEFVVGFDAGFPPYGYIDDNGKYVGFDLDLAKEVCRRRGWTFVAQPIDWDSKDMELKSGTIDCIWNGFTINGREGKYTFSDPYADNKQVVVVRGTSKIHSLKDLAGKLVAVQTESSAESALVHEKKALADTFSGMDVEDDYNSCFLNLDSGAVDAIAMDVGVADYQIQTRRANAKKRHVFRKNPTYRILPQSLASEKYAVAFKLGNTKLRDKVQETLDEMMADGTFQKIARKWNLENMIIVKGAKES